MEFQSKEYAQKQDEQDPLRHFRDQFVFPSKADLSRKTLAKAAGEKASNERCTYLCGNSLGLQTVLARKYFDQYLGTWAQKGVYGHFKPIEDTALPPWLDTDSDLQADMAAIVGAKTNEVALMQSLTVNLHLMMISFFRPTEERWKIIIEGKAFPSDHVRLLSKVKSSSFEVKYYCCTKTNEHDVVLVRSRIPTSTPPPQPLRSNDSHRTTIRRLAPNPHRSHPLNNRQTLLGNRASSTPRNPVLHGPTPRHAQNHRPRTSKGHNRRLGSSPRGGECPHETPRLERRLRRVVQLQIPKRRTGLDGRMFRARTTQPGRHPRHRF